jgi:hypothetical protein
MSDKLQQAINLIKSGDKQNGECLLAEVLRADPRNQMAWLWMSEVVTNDEQRLYCLERVLKINPDHQLAQQGLAQLQREQRTQAAPTELSQQPTSFAAGVSESEDKPPGEPQTATSAGQVPDVDHQSIPALFPLSIKRPSSIKAICYFYWFNTVILGVISLVSVLLAIGPLLTGAVTPSEVAGSTSEILFAGGILGLSVILVVLALIFAIVGWGLWQLKNWARYSAIAMSSVMVAVALISYFLTSLGGEFRLPVGLALHGLVLVTLLRQNARAAFVPAQPETESGLVASKPGRETTAGADAGRQPTSGTAPSPTPGTTQETYVKCSYCHSKNPKDAIECWHCGRYLYPLQRPKGTPWIVIWIRSLIQPRVRTFEDFTLDRRDAGKRAYTWVFFAALISGIILEFLGDRGTKTLVVVIVSLVSFAITTGLVYLFARSLGGTGSYTQHALAVAAYAAPLSLIMSLVSLIPFGDLLNLILMGYGIVLYVIAIKAVHQLGWAKAIYPLSPFLLLACLATAFLLLIGPVIGEVYSDILAEVAGLPEGCPPDCVGVDFSGTDLRMIDLRGADLRAANLRGARMDETTQIDDKWRLVWEIVNRGAQGRDLAGTDLSGAYLAGANLREADLCDANLIGADLSGADLRGAVMDETTQIDDRWRLVWETANTLPTPTATPTPTPTPTPVPVLVPSPTEPPASTTPALTGKLAIPIDDGTGHYNVVIYQLPDGNKLGQLPRSRQPNFRPDGGALIVNGEGGTNENLWEYGPDGSPINAVSASPGDHHPFYNPDGNSIVYDNPQTVITRLSGTEWHIFVQHGMDAPDAASMANDLVLQGDIFDGSRPMFPVWASDQSILFRACDYWGSGDTCGIWKSSSGMTRAGGEPWNPPALIVGGNVLPTDTKGQDLAYMSNTNGGWDVYITSINGGGGTNITDHPADDGLGTISPDGQWVAFVSNRDGRWGIWIAPISGGTAQRLPIDIPAWIGSYGGWTVERISWGP